MLVFAAGCGRTGKSAEAKLNKEVAFQISGLDGNGIAEGKIKKAFLNTTGVVDCGIDYLDEEVIVKFDSSLVSVDDLRDILIHLEEGKFKIIYEEEGEKIPQGPQLDPQQISPPDDPSDYPEDDKRFDNHG